MKITRVTINGYKYWLLDTGKIAGQRHRFHFKSKQGAEAKRRQIIAHQELIGKRWNNLDDRNREQTLLVLSEIAQAGLTVRQLWEAYQSGLIKRPQTTVSVQKAANECIAAKRRAQCRPSSINSLEIFLYNFMKGREKQPVNEVTSDEISEWMKKYTNPWTRRTMVSRLKTMFNFARRRKWVTDNPCDELDPIRIDARRPQILSVRAAGVLLRLASVKTPDALPYVVLGLFCGIRPGELRRLDWENISRERKIVTIDAAASKVRARRIVPVPDCALAWLDSNKTNGSICPAFETLRRRLRWLARRMGAKRIPADILRHTAASYSVALHGSRLTAEWLGNSETILYRHYRELVSKEDAQKFFELKPLNKTMVPESPAALSAACSPP